MFTALYIFPLQAIILFIVNVPVLSEQIQVVQPKVSTAFRYFSNTNYLWLSLMLFQNQQLILKFQRFQQFPAFLQIDLFKCSLIIRLIGLTTLFHCLPCSRQRFASKGLSGFVLYIQQVSTRSSVYPVKDELSTFIPFDSTIRISAGIFFPSSI